MWEKLVEMSSEKRRILIVVAFLILLAVIVPIQRQWNSNNTTVESSNPGNTEVYAGGGGAAVEQSAKTTGFEYGGVVIPYSEQALRQAVSVASNVAAIVTDSNLTPEQKIADVDPYVTKGLPVIGHPSIPQFDTPPDVQPLRFVTIDAETVVVEVQAGVPLQVSLVYGGQTWQVASVTTAEMRAESGQSA